MGRRAITVGVAVAVLGLAACGDGEDRPGQVTSDSGSASGSVSVSGSGTGSASGTGDGKPAFEESAADTRVDVKFVDFRFEGIPAAVYGTKVYFDASNDGKHPHELEILDAGGEPIDEIPAIDPGDDGVLAVELEPGTYTVQCLVEEKGKTHADLGMKTTFEVK